MLILCQTGVTQCVTAKKLWFVGIVQIQIVHLLTYLTWDMIWFRINLCVSDSPTDVVMSGKILANVDTCSKNIYCLILRFLRRTTIKEKKQRFGGYLKYNVGCHSLKTQVLGLQPLVKGGQFDIQLLYCNEEPCITVRRVPVHFWGINHPQG